MPFDNTYSIIYHKHIVKGWKQKNKLSLYYQLWHTDDRYSVLDHLVIPLHGNKKSWSGLYDIVGGKCINKRVQTE